MAAKTEKLEKPVERPVDAPFDPVYVQGRLAGWFPDLPAETIAKLVKYQSELIRFNKTINLVAATTIRNAEAIHIADSIRASRLIGSKIKPNAAVYDFGSGNGFPGLVFALLNPDKAVTLVDRDQRKMEFCKHVAALIGLKNVTISTKEIDELPEKSVQIVIARGFAPLQKSLLICRKQVAKGGLFFHMKSDGWANEIAALPSQIFTHWKPSLVGEYRIPEVNGDFSVVLTEKISD